MNNKYTAALQRRKRIKRAILLRKIICVFVISFVATGVFLTTHSYGKSEQSTKKVTVRCGDSLWSIGKENQYSGNLMNFICEVKEINNLDTDIIAPGDELVIPLY